MAQTKSIQLESIQLVNVSLQIEGLDPVLSSVDIEIPMDKTVEVKASNPAHAVYLLEMLAGRREPQKGKVQWQNSLGTEEDLSGHCFFEVVSGYFESERAAPNFTVRQILNSCEASSDVIQTAIEHFGLQKKLDSTFSTLSYEWQKIVMLIRSTLKLPQMLVLEDPAVGISEAKFLDFLDWIQYWQRQGHIRHMFLTNNHPTAARHLDCLSMFVDEGLIYVEEQREFKKAVQF
jgi:ABC-type molybdenum transport system ATPase subunit/photorepair protein PhrA